MTAVKPTAAVDRRGDVGIAEVLVGDRQRGLVLQHGRLGAVERGARLVDGRLGAGGGLDQFGRAIVGELRVALHRLGRGDIGLGLFDRGLVLRLLDLIEQIARLDLLTVA